MEPSFEEKLSQILTKDQIRTDEWMQNHTTFRVGGPADYYVRPKIQQVQAVVRLCKETGMPYFILGNGSNLLVGDRGIRGLVLEVGAGCQGMELEDCRIRVEAGVPLVKVSRKAAEAGLTGLEFASGIPGTVGGAIVMNAGAYGGEIKDILEEAEILCEDGVIRTYQAEDMTFSYRHSRITRYGGIVLSALLELRRGDPARIQGEMVELRARRMEKQPLEYPSGGSTFKRPDGCYAGKLIMEAGLRGLQIGGAQVSEKHCGFVINKDHATAAEILELMEEVIRRVKSASGVTLEPEVRLTGEF